jgi:hypothetical protein
MAKNRFRLRFTFWLDLLKPDEEQLADQIELLKNDRSFAGTIRDGIRLICDLRAGRLDVLFDLFPWVRAEFLGYFQSLQPPKNSAQSELERQLARVEALLVQQGSVPISTTAKTINSAGPKPLSVPQFAIPDDEEITLEIRPDTSTNSAQNFINSMFRLQQ